MKSICHHGKYECTLENTKINFICINMIFVFRLKTQVKRMKKKKGSEVSNYFTNILYLI